MNDFQENTDTVAAPTVLFDVRMKTFSGEGHETLSTSIESFEDIREHLSDKELRPPYRPESV